MKLNKSILIKFRNVILVPYRKSHVQRYHNWMESEELRILTDSERLSLEEEYEMQQTWLHDESKCTFIVLNRETYEATNDEQASMIGDVNLYLKTEDGYLVGEIGLMIAEISARGQGRGKAAALAMMRYGTDTLKVQRFIAVITDSNEASIQMFQKLKFAFVERSEVFKESTFDRIVDDDWRLWLYNEGDGYVVGETFPNE